MKAAVDQQRSLADIVEIDAELALIAHRRARLPGIARYEEIQAEQRAANDRLAALQLALEDLQTQVNRFETEIDAVRQREERDRSLLASGATDAKQLNDLQHELETLQRRQASLEDSLLEVMERREELQLDQVRELAAIDERQPSWPRCSRGSTRHWPSSTASPRTAAGAGRNSSRVWTSNSSRCTSVSARRPVSARGCCRASVAARAASNWIVVSWPGFRRRPTTTCCDARSAAQSCCEESP